MTSAQFIVLMESAGRTLLLTFASISVGLVLALFIAFLRMSKIKILNGIAWVYVWVFRGTPLFLQIMIAYYVIPIIYRNITGQIMGASMFACGMIALAMNTGAYTSEIIRAGIESIDPGQMEAAKALGMNRSQAMRKVIIPQTIKRLIPPFSNEFTTILKDTSLVSVTGFLELTKASRQFAAGGDWMFLFYGGAIYLFLTTISTLIFDRVEKWAAKSE